MEFIIIGVAIGLLPAMIAASKGGNFILWWLFGALLFVVALPCSIILKPPGKECPYCAERIKPDALVCRFCGRELPVTRAPVLQSRARATGDTVCPSCGETNAPLDSFCWACQKPLRKSGQPARPTQRSLGAHEVRCPACGEINRAGNVVCTNCRDELPTSCRFCGGTDDPTCSVCGRPQTPRNAQLAP